MDHQHQHIQQPDTPDVETPAQPIPALSPEEERVDQFCRHLAHIIRAAAGSQSSDAPDPVVVLEGE
jgi:hypothetical protein